MAEKISPKIEEYERFLNERLRADLRSVLERRDAVYSDKAEYTQLKATIQHLINEQGSPQKKNEPMKTMVDLGCNFYAKARVKDYSRIIVAIGLGFYLEMQLDEAVTFIDKKTAILTKDTEQLSEQASQINARIKMVLGALHELQFRPNSAPEQAPPPRTVW
jgi:prefoldin alpha subunit